uniref:G-protein coupled receptors family 1 profile domain-containing protein n=1 Tax=Erpetoichthys calabaricus TaxID=27687 RepID=A0A8C4RJM5_ERPCA
MESRQPLFDLGYCYPEKNRSCLKLLRKTEDYVALYIFAGVIIGLTMIGNLFVVISVSHFKQLHTTTNFLIVSLAMADFLIGVFVMPLEFRTKIETCWYFSENVCIFYIIYACFLNLVSIIHLVLISVDRYLAICHPFYYNTKMSETKMWVAIAFVVWIFVIISWIGPFIYEVLLFYLLLQVPKYCQNNCKVVLIMLIVAVDWFLTFILPFSVMICLYGKIFTVAKRHIKTTPCAELQGDSAKQTTAKTSWKRQNKATKTIGIVISVFVICWTPNYLCNIMISFIHIPTIAINAVILLGLFNSAFNPLIYGFFYPWFWKAFKVIISWHGGFRRIKGLHTDWVVFTEDTEHPHYVKRHLLNEVIVLFPCFEIGMLAINQAVMCSS